MHKFLRALKTVNRFCKNLAVITVMAGSPILLFLVNEKNLTYEKPQTVELSTLGLPNFRYYVIYNYLQIEPKGRAIHFESPNDKSIEADCEGMSFCKPNAFLDWEGRLPDVTATVFEVWPGYGVLREIEFITPEGRYHFENTDAAQEANSYRAGLTARIGGVLSLFAASMAIWLLSLLLLRLAGRQQ